MPGLQVSLTGTPNNMKTKLFKVTTKVAGKTEPMVDWYDGELAEARANWDEDCHRYGLPTDKVTVEFVECDPETLKPI